MASLKSRGTRSGRGNKSSGLVWAQREEEGFRVQDLGFRVGLKGKIQGEVFKTRRD